MATIDENFASTGNLKITLQVEFDTPETHGLDGQTAMMLGQALRALAAGALSGNVETAGQCDSFRVVGRTVNASINQYGKKPQTIVATEEMILQARLERIDPAKTD